MSCPLCRISQGKKSREYLDASHDPNLVKFFPGSTTTDALNRLIHVCENCHLAYADRIHILDWIEQKKRYDHHENIPSPGYISFLNRIIVPALPYLNIGMKGLDYGSGPGSEESGSVLAQILTREHGIETLSYDPIYHPDAIKSSSQKTFDFLFSTEVWEHLSNPWDSIQEMDSLVVANGILAVMTSPWNESTDFKSWHYTKDDTHIVFYHSKTMEWIANRFQWDIIQRPSETVWIFRKTFSHNNN